MANGSNIPDKRERVTSFLEAHQHILGYLVPYHGMVEIHKMGTS